jgi:hypothetical protein
MKNFKHSGRRGFLKMAGAAAVTLPLLEYTHGEAWANDESAGAERFITVFSHGGTLTNQANDNMFDGTGSHHGLDHWKPTSSAEQLTAQTLGAIHQPLKAFFRDLLILRGVDNGAAAAQAKYGSGGHGLSNMTALTAATMIKESEDDDAPTWSSGPSIDYVIAERLAARLGETKMSRIHLKVDGHSYGSPYYAGNKQGLSGERSPKAAFDTIFEGLKNDGQPDPAFARRRAMRESVVSGLLSAFNPFKSVVSAADRLTVEAHIDHLHTLETELTFPLPVCESPAGIDADSKVAGDIVGSQHVKLILAAFRCGLTRVANLEIADILTPWTAAGVPASGAQGHNIGHALHHMGRDAGPTGPLAHLATKWEAEMIDNRRWRMSLIKELLEGLSDPDFAEGGKTMLDRSLLLYTSEFSNGSRHESNNSPVLLAGGANGYFNTGRYLNYNQHAATETTSFNYESTESNHNLFTSILHAFGETDAHFGNDAVEHEGPLPNLRGG